MTETGPVRQLIEESDEFEPLLHTRSSKVANDLLKAALGDNADYDELIANGGLARFVADTAHDTAEALLQVRNAAEDVSECQTDTQLLMTGGGEGLPMLAARARDSAAYANALVDQLDKTATEFLDQLDAVVASERIAEVENGTAEAIPFDARLG